MHLCWVRVQLRVRTDACACTLCPMPCWAGCVCGFSLAYSRACGYENTLRLWSLP